MEQSPAWEAKRFSASQGIPHILRNPKVHYCIYKNLPTCLYPESDQSSPYPPPPPHHSIFKIKKKLKGHFLSLKENLFKNNFKRTPLP